MARPHLAINMVATVDGRSAVGGTATGIGSPRDRQLMRSLRAQFDVILHGAGTVRADPLSARVPQHLAEQRLARGLPAHPLGAIITASGNLPSSHPYYESTARVYVTSDRPVQVPVEVRRVPDVRAVIDDLARDGYSRILCEGGPRLNAALLDHGLVDELYFTLAPKLAGGDDPLTIVHGGTFDMVQLRLLSVEQHDSELFLRYAVMAQR